MKIRTGRRNRRNLYLQMGDHPSNDDPCLGFMIDPEVAALISDGLTSVQHLDRVLERVEVGR